MLHFLAKALLSLLNFLECCNSVTERRIEMVGASAGKILARRSLPYPPAANPGGAP
jgi:hypothetical protein